MSFKNPFRARDPFMLIVIAIFGTGCYRLPEELRPGYEPPAMGGGQDSVSVHMPFAAGYQSLCTQCAFGSYSHNGDATRYDIDLDTPNNVIDLVYAPVAGVAYVHDDRPNDDFGIHINIDLGDGTYIVLGHMSAVFVENGQEVTSGMMIGYEGSTGHSSGDHIHLGRHRGDAQQDAIFGESVEGLSIITKNVMTGEDLDVRTMDMTCGLSGGHTYESKLQVPLWHPDGTLVKTPSDPTVYLLEGGAAHLFMTESVFWNMNHSFDDVVLVSPAEMACYETGEMLMGEGEILGVFDGTSPWVYENLMGSETSWRVTAADWQPVLKSWGVNVSSLDDLPMEDVIGMDVSAFDMDAEPAVFRDGTLMREMSDSTVYVVSNKIAMPVLDWHTYLLMGMGPRDLMWVDDDVVGSVHTRVGSCSVNAHCLSPEDITTCGGPSDESVFSGEDSEDSAARDNPDEDYASDDSLDEDETDDGDTDPPVNSPDLIEIMWVMPDSLTADRITLSGEHTKADGTVIPWSQWEESTGMYYVQHYREADFGDTLRLSVEFESDGVTSWSCLGPYPPGEVQGTLMATFEMADFNAAVTAAPTSGGCELTLEL